jgi:dGTPase
MTLLAPYAATDSNSLGRRYPEAAPRYRSHYQRDRDRIIHSTAFRRLEYKTQVFVNHEGDLFRTRLTHSIEVAQIARTIARALQLNEDLVEAIGLAHDLGHTPFGHAGQEALNECMRAYGGFEHNLQSLRVVDELEEKYAEFPGLNLTYETREGILKHCSRAKAEILGNLGRRFLEGRQPSLEAQLTDVADAIAYNSHDVDDGLRANLLSFEDLVQIEPVREQYAAVGRAYSDLPKRRTIHELVRRLINRQVTDLIETSAARISAAGVRDIAGVRGWSGPLIGFSDEMARQHGDLKRHLFRNLYRHFRVHRMGAKAKRTVTELFQALFDDPRLLPEEHQAHARAQEQALGEAGRAQAVADYVAGMTDRYAIAEHARLFDADHLT